MNTPSEDMQYYALAKSLDEQPIYLQAHVVVAARTPAMCYSHCATAPGPVALKKVSTLVTVLLAKKSH